MSTFLNTYSYFFLTTTHLPGDISQVPLSVSASFDLHDQHCYSTQNALDAKVRSFPSPAELFICKKHSEIGHFNRARPPSLDLIPSSSVCSHDANQMVFPQREFWSTPNRNMKMTKRPFFFFNE